MVLVASAWIASPEPTDLQARVAAEGGDSSAPATVAPLLREAVVATEDERFYRHHGIDLLGVARALPYDLVHLSLAQGASTITEQLAKNLYLGGSDRNPWRKLEDAAVAVKLEDRYTKEQILDAYLATAYFGDGVHGIAAASEHYFGVAPRGLDAAQASLLAGLIKAPSAYDPRTHPESARSRQVEVLRSLVRERYLTQPEAAAALASPLTVRNGPTLRAVRGAELAPGPAFVWWKLGLGVAVAVAGAVVFATARPLGLERRGGLVVLRLPALVLLVLGLATVVRSFRTA